MQHKHANVFCGLSYRLLAGVGATITNVHVVPLGLNCVHVVYFQLNFVNENKLLVNKQWLSIIQTWFSVANSLEWLSEGYARSVTESVWSVTRTFGRVRWLGSAINVITAHTRVGVWFAEDLVSVVHVANLMCLDYLYCTVVYICQPPILFYHESPLNTST